MHGSSLEEATPKRSVRERNTPVNHNDIRYINISCGARPARRYPPLAMSDHRTKLAVVAALALSAGAVLSRCSPAPPSPSRADVATEAAAAPRDLLNRLWFDKLPEKRTDEVTIGLFFGGGIGLFESGSAYKSSFEIFEFERKATELDLTFLHDKKRSSVTYVVRACDERPPFDLCLTLEGNARGPKKLYGFAYDDDEAARVPWSRDLRASAKARAALR